MPTKKTTHAVSGKGALDFGPAYKDVTFPSDFARQKIHARELPPSMDQMHKRSKEMAPARLRAAKAKGK